METCGLFVQADSVLESALYACIESIQAVERERLGRAEAPPRQGVGAVVRQDAVRERVQLRLWEVLEATRALGHELLAERQMPHQGTGLAEGYLGGEVELERLAHVVQESGAHEQIRVQPRVKGAGLEGQRPDRDRVLDQAAEVGVVAGAGARCAPEVGAERVVSDEGVEQAAVVRVVDLAREVLE